MAKKLLNEAVVRRFQKLAQVTPINEMYHKRDDEDMMQEAEDEMEMDAEAPAMDMDADEPEMEEEGDMDLELTDDEAEVIIELGKKLEAAMGGDMEDEMDMDAEAPEMDAGDDMDMEDEVMEAMLEGINYQPGKAEIVNEVAKRVAKRLAEAKKAEKRMNEALGRK